MKTTEQLITNKDHQYSVQPDYGQERTGNEERKIAILEKWAYVESSPEESTSGNVKMKLYFDEQLQSFAFKPNWEIQDLHLSKVISSALLLYRLIATFNGKPETYPDPYKSIWGYNLIHKPTGKYLLFSEWKGSSGFWLPEYSYDLLTEQFRVDLIELLNYLVSNECIHPYDGIVAGSVA